VVSTYEGLLVVTFRPAGSYAVAIDDTEQPRWKGTLTDGQLPGTTNGLNQVIIDSADDPRDGWIASAHWEAEVPSRLHHLALRGESAFRAPYDYRLTGR
jgi:hypothetical protein